MIKTKKSEKRDKTISLRITEDEYNRISRMAHIKGCSNSQVLMESFNNSSPILKIDIYRIMMSVVDALSKVEENGYKDTADIRRRLEELCQVLNS